MVRRLQKIGFISRAPGFKAVKAVCQGISLDGVNQRVKVPRLNIFAVSVSEKQSAWRPAFLEMQGEHGTIIDGVGAGATAFVVCNSNRFSLEATMAGGRGWGANLSAPVGWKPTGKPTGGIWMSSGDRNRRRRGWGFPSSSGISAIFFIF